MASLTRTRADPAKNVPTDLHLEYYSKRGDAGLVMTEASPISIEGNCCPGAIGIYSKEQIDGWKKIVESVKKKGA